jgi:hypothetical protein
MCKNPSVFNALGFFMFLRQALEQIHAFKIPVLQPFENED